MVDHVSIFERKNKFLISEIELSCVNLEKGKVRKSTERWLLTSIAREVEKTFTSTLKRRWCAHQYYN